MMRGLWHLTLFLLCTRLQHHVLLPKQITSYFTLVTSEDKATTITAWWTVCLFPSLLLNRQMVTTSLLTQILTQNQGRDGKSENLPEKFRDTSIVVRIAPCGEEKERVTDSITHFRKQLRWPRENTVCQVPKQRHPNTKCIQDSHM